VALKGKKKLVKREMGTLGTQKQGIRVWFVGEKKGKDYITKSSALPRKKKKKGNADMWDRIPHGEGRGARQPSRSKRWFEEGEF